MIPVKDHPNLFRVKGGLVNKSTAEYEGIIKKRKIAFEKQQRLQQIEDKVKGLSDEITSINTSVQQILRILQGKQ